MIPDPLYKALPVIYILLGIFVMSQMSNMIGTVSGLILVATGVLVTLLRMSARATRRRRERIREAHALRRSVHGLH